MGPVFKKSHPQSISLLLSPPWEELSSCTRHSLKCSVGILASWPRSMAEIPAPHHLFETPGPLSAVGADRRAADLTPEKRLTWILAQSVQFDPAPVQCVVLKETVALNKGNRQNNVP